MTVEFEGMDHEIAFVVFGTTEAARQGYDAFTATAVREAATAGSSVVGFDHPALQVSTVVSGTATAAVPVPVGNVVVVDFSVASSGNPAQTTFNAAELAVSGLRHLERLASSQAAPSVDGLEIVLEARPPGGSSAGGTILDATRRIIERRLDEFGVENASVRTQGDAQIVVQMQDVDDSEAAVRVVSEVGLLEIIDPQGQFLPAGTVVTTSLGGPLDLPAAGPVYATIVDGADLVATYPTEDQAGQPVVGFELNCEAVAAFFDFTNSHLGQPMSIVLDKRVISSPVINGGMTQGFIQGLSTEEVNILVAQLRAGAHPVPLEVVRVRTTNRSDGSVLG